MRAWLLELGMPRRHVIRFQAIAPMSAAATTAWVVVASSTRPAPIVLATAVPGEGTDEVERRRHQDRCDGRRARVATEVAMALAVSWKPLM